MLGMGAVVIVGTPFMLVKAIRSGQKKRIFDFFVSDLLFFYVAVDVIWPSATASAPRPVRLLIVVLSLSGSQTFSEPSDGCLTGRKQHPLNAKGRLPEPCVETHGYTARTPRNTRFAGLRTRIKSKINNFLVPRSGTSWRLRRVAVQFIAWSGYCMVRQADNQGKHDGCRRGGWQIV